jgi:ubiquinone/menaquinone biosynthesis C-methylase UbiE
MKLYEYQRNYELEQSYWWFVGVRAMVKQLLFLSLGNQRLGKVLDIGCGTGGLLDQLQAGSEELWGMDISEEALKYCSLRGHNRLVLGDALHAPFPPAYFDVITAIGLIEHLEEDDLFLHEIRRLLKPNGIFIMLTSSFPYLWSMHDTANEHKRRYYLRQFNRKMNDIGFATIRLSHINFLLFPAIAPMLLLHRLIYGITSDHPERILPKTSRTVNLILTSFLRLESTLMRCVRLPWGISMMGAFKRRQYTSA